MGRMQRSASPPKPFDLHQDRTGAQA